MPEHELEELTQIYVEKGLPRAMAHEVAVELTKNDALKIHLAEELGIHEMTSANPLQAAVGSALSFTVGAAVPLITVALASKDTRIVVTLVVVTIGLALLGWGGARFGGASTAKHTVRVVIGGLAAMGITMLVGSLFGAAVA